MTSISISEDTKRDFDEPYKSELVLSDMYWGKGLTQREIAEEIGCHYKTIDRWMEKKNVPKRQRNEVIRPDAEEIEIKHWLENKTQSEIGEDYGVSQATVGRWIEQMDVHTRGFGKGKRSCAYFISSNGYARVSNSYKNEKSSAGVHQLIAVAEGAEPDKVFSGGQFHCHHKNGIKWDNRSKNIELKTIEKHMSDHQSQEV